MISCVSEDLQHTDGCTEARSTSQRDSELVEPVLVNSWGKQLGLGEGRTRALPWEYHRLFVMHQSKIKQREVAWKLQSVWGKWSKQALSPRASLMRVAQPVSHSYKELSWNSWCIYCLHWNFLHLKTVWDLQSFFTINSLLNNSVCIHNSNMGIQYLTVIQ